MSRPSDQATMFGGLALFGLVSGIIYWFVSYEVAGSALLLGFAIASGFASASSWRRPQHASGDDSGEGDERIPGPAFAPLIIGAGAAIIALGLVLGPLILPVGVIVLTVGARYWLQAVMREAAARDERR